MGFLDYELDIELYLQLDAEVTPLRLWRSDYFSPAEIWSIKLKFQQYEDYLRCQKGMALSLHFKSCLVFLQIESTITL